MKLYKTTVTVQSVVESRIQAKDEATARAKAQQLAHDQYPANSQVIKTKVELENESAFEIGSKVNHQKFGKGTIKDLSAMTSGAGENGWRATIEFENSGTKEIAILPGKQLLEALDAEQGAQPDAKSLRGLVPYAAAPLRRGLASASTGRSFVAPVGSSSLNVT